MRRVISVSLNGNAYQFEDDAFAVLSSYFEDSSRALAANPDRQEIIADLEQAIADKCARHLNAHKTVVTRAELEQVLGEMGRVDAPAPDAPGPGASAGSATAGETKAQSGPDYASSPSAPRRLYQISEGAIVSGLCNGIAAYSALDVTLVRAIFVAIILLTGGAALLGYLILMFVVPYASTSEEHAAARGLPFNARELVERAKLKYAQFAGGSDWRRSRAAWRKDWKRTRAQWRAHWRYGSAPPFAAPAPATPAGHAARVAAGALVAILGIGLALFTVGWLIALLSLVMTGAILGWVLPQDVPLWIAIVALIFLYYLVVWPIKTLRHLAYTPRFGYHVNWVAPWDGLVGLAIVATLIWYGYHHVPEVHSFLDHLQRL